MEKGVTERWTALYFLKNVNENEGKPVEKPACLRFVCLQIAYTPLLGPLFTLVYILYIYFFCSSCVLGGAKQICVSGSALAAYMAESALWMISSTALPFSG